MLPRAEAVTILTEVAFPGAATFVGSVAAVGGFETFFLRGLRGAALFFFGAAFLDDFLEAFPKDFLILVATAFFALFFVAFLPFFTARPLFFFTRFFAAALVTRAFCDLRFFFAFCFFEELFFGVATTNSFDELNKIVGIDNQRRVYRVVSASSPNTEKTSGFRSRL
jgi:hypothetical protein